MDNKHFIWIIPLILIIGYTLGFISGIKIPKDITLGIEPETLKIVSEISNNTLKMSENNMFNICFNNTQKPIPIICDCAKNTTTPCMLSCYKCVGTN